jgi:MerR family mercuric resistance operon transcriptional regulator
VRSPPHPRRHCERRSRAVTQRRGAGFTLAKIAKLIALDSTNDRARSTEMASDRLAALDEKIAVPEGARTALGRLRKTCTSGTKGPCPILEAFEE